MHILFCNKKINKTLLYYFLSPFLFHFNVIYLLGIIILVGSSFLGLLFLFTFYCENHSKQFNYLVKLLE